MYICILGREAAAAAVNIRIILAYKPQDAGLGRFERHHYASRLRSGAGNASQFAISLLKHIWAEANGNLGHFG